MRPSMGQAGLCRARSAGLVVALGMLVFFVALGRADEPELNREQQARLRLANQVMAEADAHFRKGQYHHAVPFLLENLRIRREVLGPQHPETLASMNNVAVIH